MMRQVVLATVLGILALSAGGCSKDDREPFAALNKKAPGFDVQLAAAQATPNAQERDEAVALVAHDAANVGDVHWAKQALRTINDWEIRDDAALAVAVRLSKGGKGEAAVEVAKSISSSAVRDQTLAFISKPK